MNEISVPVPSPSGLGEQSGTLLRCAIAEHDRKQGSKQTLFLQPFGCFKCNYYLWFVDRLREEIAPVFTPPEASLRGRSAYTTLDASS